MGSITMCDRPRGRKKGPIPSHFKGDQLPIENLDWTQAGDHGKVKWRDCLLKNLLKRGWEYAARAGAPSCLRPTNFILRVSKNRRAHVISYAYSLV